MIFVGHKADNRALGSGLDEAWADSSEVEAFELEMGPEEVPLVATNSRVGEATAWEEVLVVESPMARRNPEVVQAEKAGQARWAMFHGLLRHVQA